MYIFFSFHEFYPRFSQFEPNSLDWYSWIPATPASLSAVEEASSIYDTFHLGDKLQPK